MIVLGSVYNFHHDGLRVAQIPSTVSALLCIVTYLFLPTGFFFSPVLVYFNLSMYVLSVFLAFRWGQGNFKHIKITGSYHVAAAEIHLPVSENAISVFYPMDKHVRE
jgi:hypothetical protein